MSYKDQYSITEIGVSLEFQRLSISKDEGEVIILAVPNVNHFEHERYVLSDKGLSDLYQWLGEYFKENE